jgi:hypothetical protein
MKFGPVIAVLEVATIILGLGLVFMLFEKAGERIGVFLSNKAKLGILIGGVAVVGALNAELFYDHDLVSTLSRLDFGFFISFFPFCFGLYGGTK